MLNRRYAIALAFAAAVLPAASLLPSPARAEQAFQRFIPFLVDLPGWQGKKPEGMAMEMPGNSMITATRKYERSSGRLSAQIIDLSLSLFIVPIFSPAQNRRYFLSIRNPRNADSTVAWGP